MLSDSELAARVVERYLAGNSDDASEAISALTHDGPEGADVPAEVWTVAVGLLVDQIEAESAAT